MTIFEDTVSARGRKRRRPVTVSLDDVRAQLRAPTAVDRSWSAAQATMARAVSEGMFAIWLEPIELVATDRAGVLILGCPEGTRGWVQSRYGRLLDAAGETAGRRLRLAESHELQAVSSRLPAPESPRFGHAHKHPSGPESLPSPIHNQKEAS